MTLTVKGEPRIGLPADVTLTVYVPVTSGVKVTVQVPLPLSLMSIGDFLGPCTDTLSPPMEDMNMSVKIKFSLPAQNYINDIHHQMLLYIPAPAFLVSIVKVHGSPATP